MIVHTERDGLVALVRERKEQLRHFLIWAISCETSGWSMRWYNRQDIVVQPSGYKGCGNRRFMVPRSMVGRDSFYLLWILEGGAVRARFIRASPQA